MKRIQLPEALSLIDDKRYFILHAPRQTGKTTCLLAMVDYLNQQGQYHALYVNIEGVQTARHSIKEGMATILNVLESALQITHPQFSPPMTVEEVTKRAESHNDWLRWFLEKLSQSSDKPWVVFFDESGCSGGFSSPATPSGLQRKA